MTIVVCRACSPPRIIGLRCTTPAAHLAEDGEKHTDTVALEVDDFELSGDPEADLDAVAARDGKQILAVAARAATPRARRKKKKP